MPDIAKSFEQVLASHICDVSCSTTEVYRDPRGALTQHAIHGEDRLGWAEDIFVGPRAFYSTQMVAYGRVTAMSGPLDPESETWWGIVAGPFGTEQAAIAYLERPEEFAQAA